MPRAVGGPRLPYADLPAAVRAWVETSLGAPVAEARTQLGGMSPGCAVRLRTARGGRGFLKAVATGHADGTANLFRREIDVLSVLPPAPFRAPLLASYDDGEWVGMLLTDIEGRFPDLSAPGTADAAAVWRAVTAQSIELTPPSVRLPDLGSVAQTAQRYLEVWQSEIVAAPRRYLPGWAVRQLPALVARVIDLPARLPSETLCHWDVREDNLLVRADGSVVIVDWGMARPGPAWGDRFVLAVSWADTPGFDEVMLGWPGEPPPGTVTDLLLLIGGRLSWLAAQPGPPGLPTFTAFTRDMSRLLLSAAQRRLVTD